MPNGSTPLRVATLLATMAATELAIAPFAHAGALNYACRFGAIRMVADVHAKAGLVQEGPGQPVVRLIVPRYASGGLGFNARRGADRIVVSLRDGAPRNYQRPSRSTIVVARGDNVAGPRVGSCIAIAGAAGALRSGAVVRRAADSRAALVDLRPSGPFVWSGSTPDATPIPKGWVRVDVWDPSAAMTPGFVRDGDVAFLPR